MEKELLSVEKGMEWLVNQIEAADKSNFKMKTAAGRQKHALAKARLEDNWVNYERNGGKNPYLLAILRKRTGLPSSGGRGGLTIDFGKDAIPQGMTAMTALGKNWAWGRNKLTVNKAGTHYKSGHARGTLVPIQALEQLKKDQKWVYKALTVPKLDRSELKNVPWPVLHSNQKDIQEIFGRWGPEGEQSGRTGMLTTGGNILDRRGGLNPFANDKYIDMNAELQKGPTTTTKGNFWRRSKTTNNPVYNHAKYGVKTNSIQDLSSSGDDADVSKNFSSYQSPKLGIGSSYGGQINEVRGGGGIVGRYDDVTDSEGRSTVLSVASEDWKGLRRGDSLSKLTIGQRRQYDKEVRGF